MQDVFKRFKTNKFNQKVSDYLFSPPRLPWTIIYFGILVRVVQYLSNRSLWNDEAALALNIVNRSYLELLQPLDYDQGAPIGFLFIEKLAIQIFGDNEYALRLFPLFSAIISLFLFYKLAKQCLQPQPAIIALTLFSTLHIWLGYATEVKQYSSDVAIAVLLCLVLIQINGKKLNFTQILTFGIVGAIAIWFSYPAIFVLAGIGISYLLISLFGNNLLTAIKLLGIYTIWTLSFVCFILFH
jgi:4-amino-4-deoxy-L-arabinose transferase-like glycosyltransferase